VRIRSIECVSRSVDCCVLIWVVILCSGHIPCWMGWPIVVVDCSVIRENRLKYIYIYVMIFEMVFD